MLYQFSMGTECFKWEKERKEFVRLNNIASAGRSVDKQPKKKRRRRSRSRRAEAKKRKQRMLRHQKLSRYLRLICQNNKSFINFKGHAVLGSASNRKQEVTAQATGTKKTSSTETDNATKFTQLSTCNLSLCHGAERERKRERESTKLRTESDTQRQLGLGKVSANGTSSFFSAIQ